MRCIPAMVLTLGLAAGARGEEKKDATPSQGAPPQLPGVEALFDASIAKLPEPGPPAIPTGFVMAVTASDPAAQKHVLDGMANLQGGWDFEAYRHFAAALKIDGECLMAHWGVAVSLIGSGPEFITERHAAVRRMVDLVEKEAGTELERNYAYGIAVYFRDGAAASSEAFGKAAEKFPNDPQLKLMQAVFGRSGYDGNGRANPDQERAEKLLTGLLERQPDHPLFLNAILTIRAEAQDLSAGLPQARKLCQLAPDYPPFLHLLGHYEARSGNLAAAAEAFDRAASLYRTWMAENKVDHTECPGWVKAECYRAAVLASKGDYPTALAAAKAVAAIQVPAAKAGSEGGQLLLWEGRTLASRILMRRGAKGDAQLALEQLPKPALQKAYQGKSHAIWLYQGLAFVLEARKQLETGKLAETREIIDALTVHGESMSGTRAAAASLGERSSWARAYSALEVSASELRGDLAMAGPKDGIGSAFNWYSASLDRQTLPSMMMPPIILRPMETRLAAYYLARNEPEKAVPVLIQARTRFPSDVDVLSTLMTAFEKTGETTEAAAVKAHLEKVRGE